MSDSGSSLQFSPHSDLSSGEQAVHVQPHQTGVAKPKAMRIRVAPKSSKNLSSSGERTSWAVDHSSDDLLAPPTPYDAYSGGKSYRDFPQ